MERAHLVPILAFAAALAGCGPPPDPDALARCPSPPEASVLASLPGVTARVGDPARGEALFARECAKCHSRRLVDRGSRLFRDYPRLDCRDYLLHASPAYLSTAIAEGGPAVGRDEAMKPFAELLGAAGVADVVAYLRREHAQAR